MLQLINVPHGYTYNNKLNKNDKEISVKVQVFLEKQEEVIDVIITHFNKCVNCYSSAKISSR